MVRTIDLLSLVFEGPEPDGSGPHRSSALYPRRDMVTVEGITPPVLRLHRDGEIFRLHELGDAMPLLPSRPMPLCLRRRTGGRTDMRL